jgi:hypothetical protein
MPRHSLKQPLTPGMIGLNTLSLTEQPAIC